MLVRNNQNNSDMVYPAAVEANEAIGYSASNGARHIGLALGFVTFGVFVVVLKFEDKFIGHLKKWATHYYDKFGFKFMN
jgi:hypothetical protein